jgi:thioesterase domain-containing protein/acyl carrier protein
MVYTNSARLTCHDRFSLIHGINTQHGMTALFAALLNGAAILPFNIQRQGLDALAPWLLNYRISVLHPLPSLFRRFGQRLAPDVQFDDVRVIRLTGEPVTRTEWELFQTHFRPGCVLHVGLGSTEALHYRQRLYSWEDNPPDSVLPVGDAIPDKDVMLVDELGKPVATGEVGEIVIRSEFLFAAYWRRPALTTEVMSPDPRGLRKRVFRTGDLGRLTPDGRFFHVGRRDQQVKVVGNRIEVAEIEYALRCIDGIRDAAVVPQRRGPNESRLVAFTVVNGDPPTSLEVREGLAMRLPSHMIPSLFVIVNDLPLLPGGKVDRGALEERAASTRNAPVLARNEAEDTLVAIWQRALVTEDVGIHDDFFLDLGGDSLAAVQMLAEVREVFGRNMPLSVLHEATTVATFSPYLFDTEWVPPNNGQLAVNQDGAQLPLFGVCGAFGHALRLLLVGRALGDDQPLYGLQPPAMDWLAAGCRTIEAMAAHYVRKIRIIQPRGPYCLFGTSFGGVMAFEIAIQLQRVGEVVALLAMIDTMPPNCTSIDGIDFAERHDWAAGITVTDPLVAAGVRVARAHRVALDAHMLRDVFDGAIVYFKCLEPPVAPVADRRLRWEYFATGGIQVVPIPGRHGNFHREPQFAAVTKGLRVALNTSLAETLHHGGDTTG